MINLNTIHGFFAGTLMQSIKSHAKSQTNNQLIHVLSTAIEYKDEYNRGHSMRVANYAEEIAKEMGLSQNFIDTVYTAGLLHDMGKIVVPDSILHKPSELTEEEFAQIKRHVEYGVNILQKTDRYNDVIPMIMDHHERWDGSGYPAGKKGSEISLGGRILTVADSFDAMTSDRSYSKSINEGDAYRELRNCSGSQFDPQIVQSFLQVREGIIKN